MMIDRLMPYIDRATNLVPGFGKVSAALFTGALLLESVVRFNPSRDKGITIFFLDAIKNIQFYASFAKTSYGHSWVNVLKAHGALLPSSPFGIVVLELMTGTRDKINIRTDRPPLVSFVVCAGEAAKIGAKIVGCLATGKVIGQLVDTQISGNVSMAATAALLALSAWNMQAAVIDE